MGSGEGEGMDGSAGECVDSGESQSTDSGEDENTDKRENEDAGEGALGQSIGQPVEDLSPNREWMEWQKHDREADREAYEAAGHLGNALGSAAETGHDRTAAVEAGYSIWQSAEHRGEMLEARAEANAIRDNWQQELEQTDAELQHISTTLAERNQSEDYLRNVYGDAYETRKEALDNEPPNQELQARMDELIEKKLNLHAAIDLSRPHPLG